MNIHLSNENGKMSSYRFQSSHGVVSVTKNGGYVSYMLDARPVYEAQININDAQKSVSPMLIIDSSRLAYIPNSSGGEVLTYEFSCIAENGQTILVYVNAINGNEEQILIVYNQNDSVLTM